MHTFLFLSMSLKLLEIHDTLALSRIHYYILVKPGRNTPGFKIQLVTLAQSHCSISGLYLRIMVRSLVFENELYNVLGPYYEVHGRFILNQYGI